MIVVLLSSGAGLTLGVLIAARRAPDYTARAIIQFPNVVASADSVLGGRRDVPDPIRSQLLLLQGRDVIGRVVDLDRNRSDLKLSSAVTAMPRDAAIDSIVRHLRAAPVARTNGAEVTVTWADSSGAVQLVNEIVRAFAQAGAGGGTTALSHERAGAESLVTSALARLHAVRAHGAARVIRAAPAAAPSDSTVPVAAPSIDELALQRAQLESETELYQRLNAQLAQPSAGTDGLQLLAAIPAEDANPAISQLYSRLVGYELSRDSLTAGEWGKAATHPDVVRIDQLAKATRTRLSELLQAQLHGIATREVAITQRASEDSARLAALPAVDTAQAASTRDSAATASLATALASTTSAIRDDAARRNDQQIVNVIATAPAARRVSEARETFVLLGGGVGLLLGLAAAGIASATDRSLRHPVAAERALGITTLGIIPRRAVDRTSNARHHAAPSESREPGEAYRALRSSLAPVGNDETLGRAPSSLAVTSALPGEGKTEIAINLARAFAALGNSVILVDGDLRGSRLTGALHVRNAPGLADVVSAAAALDAAVVTSDGIDVLPCGTYSRRALDLVGARPMRDVVSTLSSRYDTIIIDTPAILVASEAIVLSAVADRAVLVVRAGSTGRDEARYVLQLVKNVGARVAGVVLNDPLGVVGIVPGMKKPRRALPA